MVRVTSIRQTAPPADGGTQDGPALARGAGQHVLIVAGEPDLAELRSTTLESAGYRISLSGSGVAALARVARRRFDLVVFDTDVPDMANFDRGAGPRSRPAHPSASSEHATPRTGSCPNSGRRNGTT